MCEGCIPGRVCVVLWRHFRVNEMPIHDNVEVDSPFFVVLKLMQKHGLRRVARAAVRMPDGSLVRWEHGVRLLPGERTYVTKVKDGEVCLWVEWLKRKRSGGAGACSR